MLYNLIAINVDFTTVITAKKNNYVGTCSSSHSYATLLGYSFTICKNEHIHNFENQKNLSLSFVLFIQFVYKTILF